MGKKTKEDVLGKEVLTVISNSYAKIFPAEKKVADFVLKNPQDAVNLNVSELASASSVSDATVVRMCHHLGYTGYYQFKIALSRDLGKKQSISELSDNTDEVTSSFNSIAEKTISLGQKFSKQTLNKCIDLIKNADTVHIVAVGNTCNLSQYMGFRLERMGIRCAYDNIPEYFLNHIHLAHPNDIVIAISKSGMSKALIHCLELAKDKGLQSIAITSSAFSDMAALATHVLDCNVAHEPFSLQKNYSYIYEFTFIDVLLDLISRQSTSESEVELLLADYKQ